MNVGSTPTLRTRRNARSDLSQSKATCRRAAKRAEGSRCFEPWSLDRGTIPDKCNGRTPACYAEKTGFDSLVWSKSVKNGPYELVIAPEEYPGKKYRGRYAYEHRVNYWRARSTDCVVLRLEGEVSTARE